jgi:hypothetical protein
MPRPRRQAQSDPTLAFPFQAASTDGGKALRRLKNETTRQMSSSESKPSQAPMPE